VADERCSLRSGGQVLAGNTTSEALTLRATGSNNNKLQIVYIQAHATNTGIIAIGDSGCVASAVIADAKGLQLNAGDPPVPLTNVFVDGIWMQGTVSGDGVTWTALV
jgi:hypothetical protein